MPYIYILKCSDGTLYTGSAKDIDERIKKHNSGKGAKYTRGRLPVKLVYHEKLNTLSDAYKREKQIQKMTKTQKIKLFKNFNKK